MANTLRNFAGAALFTSALGLAGCGSNGEAFMLNEEQSLEINEAALRGRYGLRAFLNATEPQPEFQTHGEFKESITPLPENLEEQGIPVGEELDTGRSITGELPSGEAGFFAENEVFLPYVDDGKTYVLYRSDSGNAYSEADLAALFAHPNPEFFGDDAFASLAEMEALYRDPSTVAMSVEKHSDDVIGGEEDYKLTRDDDRFHVSLKREKDGFGLNSSNAVEVVRDAFFFLS